jgi:hypothetical protein
VGIAEYYMDRQQDRGDWVSNSPLDLPWGSALEQPSVSHNLENQLPIQYYRIELLKQITIYYDCITLIQYTIELVNGYLIYFRIRI